jgi:DNA-binding NtrC family response regulator
VIHRMSKRRDGPLVEVGLTSDVGSDNLIQSNLFGHVRGAFTGAAEEKYGLFALADGGTIFLDEIGDASLELQAKLLRVLDTKSFKMLGGIEDRKVDVRIIAATNRDLARLVREGGVREDLYYRLNVIQVELPPLRDRLEDIPALVVRLFEKVCRDAGVQGKSLSDEALGLLCSFDWPGNIRQMENALRYAVAFADGTEITAEDMPEPVQEAPVARKKGPGKPAVAGGAVVDSEALRRVLDTVPPAPNAQSFDWPGHVDHARREYMKVLIEHCNGNLSEVARHWDRSSERTLLKLIREFGLEDELQAARKRH